jgi:hypothetical protein
MVYIQKRLKALIIRSKLLLELKVIGPGRIDLTWRSS